MSLKPTGKLKSIQAHGCGVNYGLEEGRRSLEILQTMIIGAVEQLREL